MLISGLIVSQGFKLGFLYGSKINRENKISLVYLGNLCCRCRCRGKRRRTGRGGLRF